MKNIFGINRLFIILFGILYICAYDAYSPRTPIKSGVTSLLAITKYSNATQNFTSEIDVTNYTTVTFFIKFARRATTAATAPVNFIVEGLANTTSLPGYWSPIATIPSGFALAVTQTTGTEAAASTVIEMGTTTSFTVSGRVFFDNSTAGNCEWGQIKSVSGGASITLQEGITNAQSSTAVYTQAEIFSPIKIDVTDLKKVRINIDGLSHTQNYAAEILYQGSN